jgi:hypothetical protein
MTVFGLQEALYALDATLAPDVRLLEAAERDAEVGTERVVANGAGSKLACYLPGAVDVLGEHRCVQPIDGVVGDPDRVGLVVGGDDTQDRAEDLLLSDRRARIDVSEHRRLDVVATLEVLGTSTSGREGRSLLDALGDVALDPRTLSLADQRAHVAVEVERIADPDLGEVGRESFQQFVVA